MESIFLAQGLSFKEKTEVEPFDHIKVYNLMYIQLAPNNGSQGSLNHLLKVPFREPSHAELSKFSVCDFTVSSATHTCDRLCTELPKNSNV